MNWESDKILIVDAYYNCINDNRKELFKRIANNKDAAKSIYPLVEFIDERLSAVWLLALNDMPWDADIVDRAVLETLIKLMFITNSPDVKERNQRLDEFWSQLWEINSLKQSDQSKKQLPFYQDDVSQLAHSPLVLSEEEDAKLRQKWSKKERQKLEQKWSFSEILLSLAKNYKGQPFEMLVGLAHEYRMCSHIAHGDGPGLSIIQERKSRNDKQRNDVQRAHFLKKLSNCLAYSSFLSFTVMDFINMDKSYFGLNFKKIEAIKGIEKQYLIEVFNDSLYDKYKK